MSARQASQRWPITHAAPQTHHRTTSHRYTTPQADRHTTPQADRKGRPYYIRPHTTIASLAMRALTITSLAMQVLIP